MLEVIETTIYSEWIAGLTDLRARGRIAVRIDRLAAGNPGDVKSVGEGVSELRIDYGPGYRVYFTRKGRLVVLLLCGGDKSTQERDIVTAKAIAKEYKNAR
jgi:putative addiction module killer protein